MTRQDAKRCCSGIVCIVPGLVELINLMRSSTKEAICNAQQHLLLIEIFDLYGVNDSCESLHLRGNAQQRTGRQKEEQMLPSFPRSKSHCGETGEDEFISLTAMAMLTSQV